MGTLNEIRSTCCYIGLTLLLLALFNQNGLYAQTSCTGVSLANVTVDFGANANMFDFPDIGNGDIANGNSPSTGLLEFDLFDGIGLGQDGTPDFSLSMTILPTNDPYGGLVLETSSSTHQIQQSTSGLQGSMAHGTSGATNSTTGDVRCYQISLNFAENVQIAAEDFTVLLNSVNTAGQAFESTSIVFLNNSGLPYGTSNYTGYYSDPPSGTGTTSSNPPIVSTEPWASSGTGVYVAANTGTVDISIPTDPTGGINGPLDNYDPNAATDTGLLPTDLIGGFLYTVCLEDVAATQNDGDITSSQTSFTSTLQGLLLGNICLGELDPLAAELVDFQINNDACRAVLTWKTLSESNLSHFEIERSEDGTEYQSIGRLNATGNSTQTIRYEFQDPNALQKSYYRLKMVDEDATWEHSNILFFESSCKSGFYLTNLYPNPTQGDLTIAFHSDRNRAWQMAVTDVLGRNLLVEKTELLQGFNQFTLATASLSSGVYLLRLTSEGHQVVRKFIVD